MGDLIIVHGFLFVDQSVDEFDASLGRFVSEVFVLVTDFVIPLHFPAVLTLEANLVLFDCAPQDLENEI